MWTLESPGYILLLFLVPVAVYIRHFLKNRGGKILFPIKVFLGDGFSPSQRGLKFIFFVTSVVFWTGIVFIILSLAEPSYIEQQRVYLNRGNDIMIVLDESPSMAARDFEPENRFEAAREVIHRFISRRENDAIGLVSFSKEAALRIPPTLDYDSVLDTLDSLQIMDLGDGTAIGMGIAVACLHLQNSTAENKIIILLTDGENNAGEIIPETAAEIASQLDVRIYTIGIGSEGEIPLEFTDPHTGRVYRGTFVSGFDAQLLEDIAETSGGRYYYASTSNTLDDIFTAIDSLEALELRSRTHIQITPYYRIFLFIGLICVLLDLIFRKLILREVL
ncbi:MAG: VWA domain-containing protein [Spirochaetia bacterium]